MYVRTKYVDGKSRVRRVLVPVDQQILLLATFELQYLALFRRVIMNE